jgi:hypothetical protein
MCNRCLTLLFLLITPILMLFASFSVVLIFPAVLDLSHNRLTGTIFPDIENLSNLRKG